MKGFSRNIQILLITLILISILLCSSLLLIFSEIDVFLSYLFIILYLFVFLFYCYLERKKLVSIKSLFVLMYTFMIGISPFCYFLNRGVLISETNKSIIYQYPICFIGFLILIAGMTIISKTKIKKEENIVDRKIIKYNFVFSLILISVSTIANLLYISSYSDYFFGGNLEQGRINALASNGLILLISGLNVFGNVLLFDCVIKTKKYKKTFILSIIMFIIFYIIRGSRTPIFRLFICIVLLYNLKKSIKLKSILLLIMIALTGLSLLQIQRNFASNSKTKPIYKEMAAILENGSVNLDYVYNSFPNKVAYQYGYTYLINIKMLMPGKDDDFTLWLKNKLNLTYDGGGLTPTLFGEGYINFGIIGGFLSVFIIGIIGGFLNIKYFYKSKNAAWIIFVSVLVMDSFRGGFSNIEVGLLTIFALFIAYKLLFVLFVKE